MKVLHIDLPSGISGDMTLAAFLDAGVPESVLREGLARFGLRGYEMIVEPGQKGGISGKHVNVLPTGEAGHGHDGREHGHHAHDGHAHDVHGHDGHEHEGHGHEEHGHDGHGHDGHEHEEHGHEEHGHDGHGHDGHEHEGHEHEEHGHDGHGHAASEGHAFEETHAHGNWRDIRKLISESALLESERDLAIRIFQRIADAEGKIHGKPADEVGFHEVGAVDSIVDIVGAAICFNWLKPDVVTASPVNTGSGFVRCAHGLLPVPAPATAAILSSARVPVYAKGSPGERTTPTGAAILAEFAGSYGLMPPMVVTSIGYGVGTKDFDSPNILRMMIGETTVVVPGETAHEIPGETAHEIPGETAHEIPGETAHEIPGETVREVSGEMGSEDETGLGSCNPGLTDEIVILETNLDDMTGEAAGYLIGKLLESGARDAFYTPVFMKKNRPGMLLTVLSARETVSAMESLIFRESSTIGIRRTSAARSVMNRRHVTVSVAGFPVLVKVCDWNGISKAAPEYESVSEVARKTGLPFREVYRMAEAAHALLSVQDP